jgi:hypothetical protein
MTETPKTQKSEEAQYWYGGDFDKMPEALKSLWHPRDARRVKPIDLLVLASSTTANRVYFTLPGEQLERDLPWKAPDMIAHKGARREGVRSIWVMIHPSTPFRRDNDRPSPLKLLLSRPHPTPMQDLTAPSMLGDPRAISNYA